MEEILNLIVEAEKEAAAKKQIAEEEAAKIVASGELRVAEIEKQTETELKALRSAMLNKAENEAQAEYEKTLSLSSTRAQNYADGLLSDTEISVNRIVGRVLGDC